MQTLNSIVKIIIENWYLFIAAIAVTAVVSIAIYKFFKQPSEDQINSLKEWLLYAISIAEKNFGSGNGEIKLRYVYDLFLKAFPALTDYISFENFSKLVDNSLDELEKLLENNNVINELVTGKNTSGVTGTLDSNQPESTESLGINLDGDDGSPVEE